MRRLQRRSVLCARTVRRAGSQIAGDPRTLVLTVVLVGWSLLPLFGWGRADSFPHSTYPMFSYAREPIADIDVVRGRRADGTTVTLSPELIAGTVEVIVAGSIVRQSVASGTAATARLCRDVAARVAMNPGDVVTIEVATETFDAVRWFAGDTSPMLTDIHTRCPIERPASDRA